MPRDMNQIVGTHDIVLITLDTLRYDVATVAFDEGEIPNLASQMPGRWQKRHSPGSFTWAAHQSFFAGFLPTPVSPGRHPRLFALEFEGSETTAATTCVLQGATIVEGLERRGYRTVCVGGVGFFNQRNALGSAMPNLFTSRHWSPALGVTNPASTDRQVEVALDELALDDQRVFLFLNISALHQPNCHYVPGATRDTPSTQRAALAYVDGALGPLWSALGRRGPAFAIVCSDHGTAYGEDGYTGHRLGHEVVWTVPYTEFEVTK